MSSEGFGTRVSGTIFNGAWYTGATLALTKVYMEAFGNNLDGLHRVIPSLIDSMRNSDPITLGAEGAVAGGLFGLVVGLVREAFKKKDSK